MSVGNVLEVGNHMAHVASWFPGVSGYYLGCVPLPLCLLLGESEGTSWPLRL